MRSEQRAPMALKIAAAGGLLFLHLPILLIFVYAWPPPGFTFKWLAVTWNRPDIWDALALSVKVASISTLIALLLGTLCAAAVSRSKFFGRETISLMVILPIALPQDQVDLVMKDAEKGANARITIDLETQTVTTSDGDVFAFEVDAFKKHCLMNGLDDIGLTMEKAASIDTFEATAAQSRPWV